MPVGLPSFAYCPVPSQGNHSTMPTRKQVSVSATSFSSKAKSSARWTRSGQVTIVAVAKLKETTTGDTLCSQNNPLILEAPAPLSPVITYAVSAKKGDEEKLFSSLSRMLDEDLSLKMSREQQTGETLVSGMSQVHLEVVGNIIKRKFGVEMELNLPKIPYMETIKELPRPRADIKNRAADVDSSVTAGLKFHQTPVRSLNLSTRLSVG